MAYEDLKDKKEELIRRFRTGSAFRAPMSAEPITALTSGATADLKPLPAGYEDIGHFTEEGLAFAGETTESPIRSAGESDNTRSDMIGETASMTVVAQETKALTLGLITGADRAALVTTPETGELSIKRPSVPISRYHRLLALAVDYDDDGTEIYIARFFPRAKITAKQHAAYAPGDQALQYSLTFTAFKDSALGYPEHFMFGGPGWQALLDKMGFTENPI